MNPKPRAVVGALLLVGAVTYGKVIGQEASSGDAEQTSLDCDPTVSEKCARARLHAGRKLFDVETFDGNGRTCRTCHSKKNGTFSPEDAQERLAADTVNERIDSKTIDHEVVEPGPEPALPCSRIYGAARLPLECRAVTVDPPLDLFGRHVV